MRIAHVHYAAPPAVGGVERVLAQQAQVMAANGHEVVIVCANKEAKVKGATVELAPTFYIKRLRSAFTGCQKIIVHNMFTMPFNPEASATLAELSREMKDVEFINWVHDVDVTREAFDALATRASHVAVSEVRRDEFCAMSGVKKTQCKVVPNGIDIAATMGLSPHVAAFAAKHRLLERDLVLFHPARIVARKNIELGVEVTAALRKLGVDAAYVATGAPDIHRPESADYAVKIRALVEKKKMQESVLFAAESFAPNEEDVRSLFSLSDALFFPSSREGFGIPLLEATVQRLPVFCSDIPIHREVIGRAAHFFGLGDKAAAIAEMIRKAMASDVPSKRRHDVMRDFGWTHLYKTKLEPLLKA